MTMDMLLDRQKEIISILDTRYKEMKKKRYSFSKKVTVELIERWWVIHDRNWKDVKKSIDEEKKIVETLKEKESVDELIRNHDRIMEFDLRLRKEMINKVKKSQRRRERENKDSQDLSKEKAENMETTTTTDTSPGLSLCGGRFKPNAKSGIVNPTKKHKKTDTSAEKHGAEADLVQIQAQPVKKSTRVRKPSNKFPEVMIKQI